MGILNPHLYLALKTVFGVVRISNQGTERTEQERTLHTGERYRHASVAGENYAVNCPLCGDEKGRLSFSYTMLSRRRWQNTRTRGLVHCYNEHCENTRRPAMGRLLDQLTDLVQQSELGLLDQSAVPRHLLTGRGAAQPMRDVPFPDRLVLLRDLPSDHPGVVFVQKKYNLSVDLLSSYGVGCTDTTDPRFVMARERVIFQILHNGRTVAWQGRTYVGREPRWFIPAGWGKCVYNMDNVLATETPYIAEGIPSAIACGPNGVCVFGKSMPEHLAESIGRKWPSRVVVATDPETFVPDYRNHLSGVVFAHRMAAQLSRYVREVRLLQWPRALLDIATAHNDGQTIDVPDAADLGVDRMAKIVTNTVRYSEQHEQIIRGGRGDPPPF